MLRTSIIIEKISQEYGRRRNDGHIKERGLKRNNTVYSDFVIDGWMGR
jgi:hypothetical protein